MFNQRCEDRSALAPSWQQQQAAVAASMILVREKSMMLVRDNNIAVDWFIEVAG